MKKSKILALVCAAVMGISAAAVSVSALTERYSAASAADYVIDGVISNPNADGETKAVYKYICDNFGSNMISCQMESTWMGSPDYEMNIIQKETGRLPAMRGLDFMNDDFDGVVKRAIEWHNKGGLVTICWHCGVNGKGYTESLNDDPDFSKLLTEGTKEYEGMMASWDRAAKALQKLQDEGVTVLWRPFHEFDGQWFWWGKGGADNFIKLWRLMYDKFTNEYKLNNLIWVLGYSGEVKQNWYPGDEYCDIIGSDTYDNSTNLRAWKKLAALNTGKPLAFHECGNLPSVEKFESDGDLWSWFMVWHTDYIVNNDKANLKEVYNSDKVITLDEVDIHSEVKQIPAKVQMQDKFTSTDSAVRVNWNAVKGADGYTVYRYNGFWAAVGTIDDPNVTTLREGGLEPGSEYKYRVVAYIENGGEKQFGEVSDDITAATKPSKVTITSASKSKTAVRLNWKKVSCSGYKIQQYNSSTKKWETIKLISSDKTTYRISKLKSNKTYKFRIQAYKKTGTNKTYSAWSSDRKSVV